MTDRVVEHGSTKARNLTAFQQAILAVLAEDPRYGLAIKDELEAFYGEDINHGRLYPNLDELETLGLVEKRALDKRTNEYELTNEGYAAVVDLLEWFISRVVTDGDRASVVNEFVETATQ